jgi:hypothetical protein
MDDDATEMDIIKSGKIKQSSRSMNNHQDDNNHRYFHNVINSKPNNHVKYSLLGDTITPSKTMILEEKEPNTYSNNSIEESHLVSYHHDHVSSSKGRFYSLSTTATVNTTATESTFCEDGSDNNHPPRTATLFSCYINLCCTIIGAGMLGDTNI